MTREEQIEKAEIEYFNKTSFDGCDYVGEAAKTAAFIAGAKWADENPKEGLVSLDKICDLLNDMLIEFKNCDNFPSVHAKDYPISKWEFIENFRKAMEE